MGEGRTEDAVVEVIGTRVEKLAVGSFSNKDILFKRGYRSCFGTSILRQHIATFDFPNKVLYLRKSRYWGEPIEPDMSGLHLLKSDGVVAVHSVDEGSPAYKAGLRSKDVLTQINGVTASDMKMWRIRQILRSGDGNEVTLTFVRHGEEKSVTIVLKRRI